MTRFGFVITTYAATLFVALSSLFHPAPKLLWNASASVPIGLYAVRRAPPLHVGELVVVQPPAPLAQFFAARRYLPLGVPLVKRILALPGQTVCRTGRAHHRRWRGHGRRARTRPPRPCSAGLAGLPRARAGRSLPHESHAAGLSRRPVFRASADDQHRRPRRSDLDPRGELTMPQSLARSAPRGVVHASRLFLLPGHRRTSRSPYRLTSIARASPSPVARDHGWCCCRRAALLTRRPATGVYQPSRRRAVALHGSSSEAALRFGIPTSWITAVMQAESRGVVRAVSPKGAMGLMQIMPDTWSGLRVAIRPRRRSIRPARQHPGGRGVSSRAA